MVSAKHVCVVFLLCLGIRALGQAPRLVVPNGQTQGVQVRYSLNGRRVLSWSGDDLAVRLWDAGSGRELVALPVGDHIVGAACSFEGTRIAAATGKLLRLWDSESGKRLYQLEIGDKGWGMAGSLAFSPDTTKLLLQSDGGVRVFDAKNGEEIFHPRTAKGLYFTHAAFSSNGRQIVTVSMEKDGEKWIAITDSKGHASRADVAPYMCLWG